jgi:glycyl-tRNA synthetase
MPLSSTPVQKTSPKLAGTIFQKDLGTLLDKSDRAAALAGPLADLMGLTAADRSVALDAARLARADLATSTVTEMTALAGTMGRCALLWLFWWRTGGGDLCAIDVCGLHNHVC